MKVGEVDIEGLKRDIDQLHAQAAHRESSGVSTRLPEEFWADNHAETEKRRELYPWVDTLDAVLGHIECGKIRYADVWKIVGVEVSHRNSATGSTLIDCAKELKWYKTAALRRLDL